MNMFTNSPQSVKFKQGYLACSRSTGRVHTKLQALAVDVVSYRFHAAGKPSRVSNNCAVALASDLPAVLRMQTSPYWDEPPSTEQQVSTEIKNPQCGVISTCANMLLWGKISLQMCTILVAAYKLYSWVHVPYGRLSIFIDEVRAKYFQFLNVHKFAYAITV